MGLALGAKIAAKRPLFTHGVAMGDGSPFSAHLARHSTDWIVCYIYVFSDFHELFMNQGAASLRNKLQITAPKVWRLREHQPSIPIDISTARSKTRII